MGQGAPPPAAAPARTLRALPPAGIALFGQLAGYARLIGVDWAEERERLLQLGMAALLGFVLLQCLLFSLGALVLVLCWSTPWRLPAMGGVILLYALGAALAWRRVRVLAARSGQAFAATRRELAADLAQLAPQEDLGEAGAAFPRSQTLRLLLRRPMLAVRLVAGVVRMLR